VAVAAGVRKRRRNPNLIAIDAVGEIARLPA
jgi:hypothetical protein